MRRCGAIFFQPSSGGRAAGPRQQSDARRPGTERFPEMFPSPRRSGQDRSPVQRAVELAGTFSPRVEAAQDGMVLLDLSGLEKQWPDETELAEAIERAFREHRLQARVAIASSPLAASLLAQGGTGSRAIPPHREQALLAALPLQLLRPSRDLQRTLEQWGLRTLGDLAALAPDALVERLGREGLELFRKASGLSSVPLIPSPPEEVFEACLAFDWPLENSQALAFALRPLLEDLCRQLLRRSLAAEAIELNLETVSCGRDAHRPADRRLLRLHSPLHDTSTLLSLIRLRLEAQPPAAPLRSLRLRLHPAVRRTAQFSLLDPPLPAPEKLARTLAKLASIVGEKQIGSPRLLDTHRPDAFLLHAFHPWTRKPLRPPENPHCGRGETGAVLTPPGLRSGITGQCPLALRRFRPPLAARVRTVRMRPHTVDAAGISGQVLECSGPWRCSGEWWKPGCWNRDEWDALLGDGTLCRLHRDRLSGAWFVDGHYD